jgi:DNA-binding NtrC family response regulator
VDVAVDAMKAGAFHFVTKPVHADALLSLVDQGLETNRLRREVRALRQASLEGWRVALVGASAAIDEVKRIAERIARSPATTVLITGESGTGKDIVARGIHSTSGAAGRFVNITCSAIPEALLESELFGHEKGAFTGAASRKLGLFEEAADGTVFLDEIGEMPLGLQAKLLRFLESRTLRRVGGSSDIQVDVRIVAATHRTLSDEVAAGRFRADLLYRLTVLTIHMPPLRDRPGDVSLLAKAFVERYRREFGAPVRAISDAALRYLESHSWPGNVRELKNAVERAVLLAEHDVLDEEDFKAFQPQPLPATFSLPPDGIALEPLEVDLVRQALERTDGNRTRAAALLGMNRDQIRYRIEKYGLAPPWRPRG